MFNDDKLHLCCGSVYLKDYVNCDIDGIPVEKIKEFSKEIELEIENPNETTLDKYFKRPFEPDVTKRKRYKTIVDIKMDILQSWKFGNEKFREIVMVSAFEHFEHKTELKHIINEAYRVLKRGGVWKFDFPDIVKQVEQYKDKDDEFMMELIYCNHKDKFSIHQWGYTRNTLHLYLPPSMWSLEFKDIVKHDYPMIGCWAIRK